MPVNDFRVVPSHKQFALTSQGTVSSNAPDNGLQRHREVCAKIRFSETWRTGRHVAVFGHDKCITQRKCTSRRPKFVIFNEKRIIVCTIGKQPIKCQFLFLQRLLDIHADNNALDCTLQKINAGNVPTKLGFAQSL